MNKIWWIIPVVLIVVLIPTIASTSLGKPFFIKTLEVKTGSQIEVETLRLSWLGPQTFRQLKWSRGEAHGTAEELQIQAPFWSFSGPFHLTNGTLNYQGERIEQIEGQIEGDDLALSGKTLQGTVSLQGKVISKRRFDVQIEAKNISIPLFKRVDVHAVAAMHQGKGTLQLDVNGLNLKTSVRGALTEHALTLQEPLIAHFTILAPATLRIETQGFSFPYALDKLKVGRGTLDLGKFQYRNEQAFDTLFHLSHTQFIDLWCTPVQFQIENGLLTAGRMDVLAANSIHLCLWGAMQLKTQQLDMTLGIPADTLQKSFGIKHISPNYVLKVPVRGTLQNPEFAFGPAAAQIATLVAARKLSKKGLFEGVSEIFSRDAPPAQYPFPWQS